MRVEEVSGKIIMSVKEAYTIRNLLLTMAYEDNNPCSEICHDDFIEAELLAKKLSKNIYIASSILKRNHETK